MPGWTGSGSQVAVIISMADDERLHEHDAEQTIVIFIVAKRGDAYR